MLVTNYSFANSVLPPLHYPSPGAQVLRGLEQNRGFDEVRLQEPRVHSPRLRPGDDPPHLQPGIQAPVLVPRRPDLREPGIHSRSVSSRKRIGFRCLIHNALPSPFSFKRFILATAQTAADRAKAFIRIGDIEAQARTAFQASQVSTKDSLQIRWFSSNPPFSYRLTRSRTSRRPTCPRSSAPSAARERSPSPRPPRRRREARSRRRRRPRSRKARSPARKTTSEFVVDPLQTRRFALSLAKCMKF